VNGKHFLIATLVSFVLLIVVFIPISSQQVGSYYHQWHGRTTRIKLVIEMNTTLTYISFNGMSIRDVYAYTITDGRPVLRYDRGFNIMMNQITISNAYFLYPYFRIEIPLRVLISNETISMEVYNDGGSSEDLTTITFYNVHGELAASFTKYAYSVLPPLRTETFYITSEDLL